MVVRRRLPGPQARAELRYVASLRELTPRVALFLWRARRLAARSGDRFSLISATRPRDLALLLELARGRRRVVELGTGTGWTALALALDDPRREVVSYDLVLRPERDRYAALVPAGVRERVRFVVGRGADGPSDHLGVDLLYVDSSHEREQTIEEIRNWAPVLRTGALVIFDDYSHPDYPGVREAVAELELAGEQRGTLFVHEVRVRLSSREL